MKKENVQFAGIFILGILILLYFLGGTITGYVTQTMHCEEGVCKELCNFVSDCSDKTKICCDKGGFGVCEDPLLCEKGYELSPEADMSFDIEIKEPSLQRPAQVEKSRRGIYFYLILLFLALVIGFIYVLRRKK